MRQTHRTATQHTCTAVKAAPDTTRIDTFYQFLNTIVNTLKLRPPTLTFCKPRVLLSTCGCIDSSLSNAKAVKTSTKTHLLDNYLDREVIVACTVQTRLTLGHEFFRVFSANKIIKIVFLFTYIIFRISLWNHGFGSLELGVTGLWTIAGVGGRMSQELGGCGPEMNQLVLWITVAFIQFKIQLNPYYAL